MKHKNEDIIRFRFQPDAKKLVIDIVSLYIATQITGTSLTSLEWTLRNRCARKRLLFPSYSVDQS